MRFARRGVYTGAAANGPAVPSSQERVRPQAVEALPDRVPLAEALGQVPPGDPGLGNPQDGVDKQPVVLGQPTGLAGPTGPLLTVDWSQPYGRHQRPIMHFVFDGGTIPADTPIKVQAEELDGYRFTERAELASYVPPYLQARISAALAGRARGATVYQPTWPG